MDYYHALEGGEPSKKLATDEDQRQEFFKIVQNEVEKAFAQKYSPIQNAIGAAWYQCHPSDRQDKVVGTIDDNIYYDLLACVISEASSMRFHGGKAADGWVISEALLQKIKKALDKGESLFQEEQHGSEEKNTTI